MQATYKKVEDYFNWVSVRKNQAEHVSFLNARKDWIKQHNEGGPDCKRLQSKKSLLEAKKTLNVVRNVGGRFIAPKKKFVDKDNWNEKEHGVLDPNKVVTEHIFGKEIQGCWILKGKKGEYDFEEYQDTALQEKEQLHNSADAPFSEEALGRKRKAMMDEFVESSTTRDKASVEGQELSMQGLLAAIQMGHDPSSGSTGEAVSTVSASGEVQSHEAEEESTSDCASEEEEARPSLSFAPRPPKAKAHGKPAAKPQAKGSTQPSKAPSSSVVPVPAPSAPAAKKTTKTEPAPSKVPSKGTKALQQSGSDQSLESAATLLADGRAQRALKNLQESVAKWKSQLADIRVDDAPPAPDAQAQTKFKQACIDRANVAKALARQARDYGKRMDKSSNKDNFLGELEELQKVEFAAVAVQALFQIAGAQNSAPTAVVKAFEDASEHVDLLGCNALGAGFQLKYAFAKAGSHCLYQEYEKYCAAFLGSSELMKGLAENIGQDSLQNHVMAEMEGRLTLALRTIKPTDVQAVVNGLEEPSNLQECADLCKAVMDVGQKHGSDFLASGLGKACTIAFGIVSSADIEVTNDALKEIQSFREGDAKDEKPGAIMVYFLEHTVGKSLVDLATGRVGAGETEAVATEHLKTLQGEVSKLQSVCYAGSVAGVQLISADLEPVDKLIGDCQKSIACLKSGKDTKGKNAKHEKADAAESKQRHRAHDRLVEALNEYKASFAERARELLLQELKANLSEQLLLGLENSSTF